MKNTLGHTERHPSREESRNSTFLASQGNCDRPNTSQKWLHQSALMFIFPEWQKSDMLRSEGKQMFNRQTSKNWGLPGANDVYTARTTLFSPNGQMLAVPTGGGILIWQAFGN